jgi:hypothetical protein
MEVLRDLGVETATTHCRLGTDTPLKITKLRELLLDAMVS